MTHRHLRGTRRILIARARASHAGASRGQTLVEFSLVLPIFIFMLLAIVEFAFVFNAMLGISFASRDAALIAAEAGSASDADCAILRKVSADLTPPINQTKISSVVIYRTDNTGSPTAYSGQSDTYVPGGSTTCTGPDGVDYSVAFTASGSLGYTPTSRCNVLQGCGGGRTLDTIGVQITYVHTWVTPLRGLGGPQGATVTVKQSNAMRMEPIL